MGVKIVQQGRHFYVERCDFPWTDVYRLTEGGMWRIDGYMAKACNTEEEAVELYRKHKQLYATKVVRRLD